MKSKLHTVKKNHRYTPPTNLHLEARNWWNWVDVFRFVLGSHVDLFGWVCWLTPKAALEALCGAMGLLRTLGVFPCKVQNHCDLVVEPNQILKKKCQRHNHWTLSFSIKLIFSQIFQKKNCTSWFRRSIFHPICNRISKKFRASKKGVFPNFPKKCFPEMLPLKVPPKKGSQVKVRCVNPPIEPLDPRRTVQCPAAITWPSSWAMPQASWDSTVRRACLGWLEGRGLPRSWPPGNAGDLAHPRWTHVFWGPFDYELAVLSTISRYHL